MREAGPSTLVGMTDLCWIERSMYLHFGRDTRRWGGSSFVVWPKADFLWRFGGGFGSLGFGFDSAAFSAGADDAVALEELGGKVAVGFGTARLGVVDGDGLAVTRGFCQADVAGDSGGEELVLEELAEVGGDLLGEVGTVIDHGEDDAFKAERRVEGLGDAVEGADELGDAFKGEVLGLHGDEEAIGGDEGIEGEQIEGGRAVEQDERVVGADGREGVAQAELSAILADKLEVGADQIFASGDERQVLEGSRNEGIGESGLAKKHVVDVLAISGAFEAEAAGGVGLWVYIDEEGGQTVKGKGGGEVNGGGGFADATFLVDDGEDAAGRAG